MKSLLIHVIVANKDWKSGCNPGVLVTAAKGFKGAVVPGVSFNAGLKGGGRIDLGPFDVEHVARRLTSIVDSVYNTHII